MLLLGRLEKFDTPRDDGLPLNIDDHALGNRTRHIDPRWHAFVREDISRAYVAVSPLCHHRPRRPDSVSSGLVRKSSSLTRHPPSSRRR